MVPSLDEDARGVSESASIAVLVVMTVLVTASVGVGVLFVDADEGGTVEATFSFQYFSQRQALLITYEDGDELRASNVVVRGRDTSGATWASLRGLNDTATISPGAVAQIHEDNAYGRDVTEESNISVVYVQGDNETVLERWSGG